MMLPSSIHSSDVPIRDQRMPLGRLGSSGLRGIRQTSHRSATLGDKLFGLPPNVRADHSLEIIAMVPRQIKVEQHLGCMLRIWPVPSRSS
jgi:hypothetical protein